MLATCDNRWDNSTEVDSIQHISSLFDRSWQYVSRLVNIQQIFFSKLLTMSADFDKVHVFTGFAISW